MAAAAHREGRRRSARDPLVPFRTGGRRPVARLRSRAAPDAAHRAAGQRFAGDSQLHTFRCTGRRALSDHREARRARLGVAARSRARWHDARRADAARPLSFDLASPRPAVLVSAGIGITPMIAMLRRALADAQPSRRVVFVHGAREAADRPFAEELARVAATDARLSLHWFDSHPHEGAAAHAGRIDIAQLKRILSFDDYDFYLCGPSAFMRDLYDGLRALNVPDERIRFEAFGPSSVARSATVRLPRRRRRACRSSSDAPAAKPRGRPPTAPCSNSRKGSAWTCRPNAAPAHAARARRACCPARSTTSRRPMPRSNPVARCCASRGPRRDGTARARPLTHPCDMRPQMACCAKSARNCFFECRLDRR